MKNTTFPICTFLIAMSVFVALDDEQLVDGYNSKGCHVSGLSVTGEVCEVEDIPRVYNHNSVDQFGLHEEDAHLLTQEQIETLEMSKTATFTDSDNRDYMVDDIDFSNFSKESSDAAFKDKH